VLIECPSCGSHFVVDSEGQHPCPVCSHMCGGQQNAAPSTPQEPPPSRPPESAWDVGPIAPPMPSSPQTIHGPPPVSQGTHSMCAIHAQKEAEGVCTRCGNFYCDECRGMIDGQPFCAPCYYKMEGEARYIVWEDASSSMSFYNKFMATVKEVMFSPSTFFDSMPLKGGYGKPILFAMICMGLGSIGIAILQVGMLVLGASSGGRSLNPGFLIVMGFMYVIVMLVSIPMSVVMAVFVGGGIYHGCLKLFGGGEKGYEATVRVLCYATAPYILGLIPLCGMYIGAFWQMGLQIYGAKRAHDMTLGRVLMAVFVPFFVVMIIVAIFVLAVIALVGVR